MNLLRVLAFNGQNISSEILASYLHFLLEPNEHNLDYQFLHSFLTVIDQKLNHHEDLLKVLNVLDNDAQNHNTLTNVDTLSGIKLEGTTIDLIIKCPKITILCDIQTSKSRPDKLIDGYLKFIQNNPFNSDDNLVCCTINDQESIDRDFWNQIMRSQDRHICIPYQHPDPAIPSLNKIIFHLFRVHGLTPGKTIREEVLDAFPGFKLLNDLWDFIDNNFQGYGFMDDVSKVKGVSLLNSIQLESKREGFVYFHNGISGLMRLYKEQILTYQFPYIVNRPNSHGWIEINKVQSYLKWFMSSKSFRQNRGDIRSAFSYPHSNKIKS